MRNGANASGTPTFRCRGCVRRFVAAPKNGPVGESDRALVRRLLGERVVVRAIARITGRSRSWIQGFVNAMYREGAPHHPGPTPKRPGPSCWRRGSRRTAGRPPGQFTP
ncbi:hypothetical protein J8F10_05030 [Gemmata sp. G18]|uniref:Helix-turn-helix domain-containing protein n=1 Tax=Gemmata palustris TaxID=2822762 RepID=A0ABS5BLU5_9BACT|nr:hypothetical protein [Gemmata palustris]